MVGDAPEYCQLENILGRKCSDTAAGTTPNLLLRPAFGHQHSSVTPPCPRPDRLLASTANRTMEAALGHNGEPPLSEPILLGT